jgi:nucleotide-binding universal stress UspA family protein
MRHFVASTLVLLLGCAPRELQGPVPCVRERCRETLTVAVAAFQDDRPVVEIGTPPVRPYPVAEALAENMSTELAQHLVDRFNSFGFFLSSSVVEVSGSPPSPELLRRLAGQGFDAVVTGNVPRCLGSTCVIGGDLAGQLVLRAVGFMFQAFLPLPLGYYHNKGVVSVTDLRLTDTRTGEVVWKGDFTREVVLYTIDPTPEPAIHEAMLDVVGAILADLEANLKSGRQGAPVSDQP